MSNFERLYCDGVETEKKYSIEKFYSIEHKLDAQLNEIFPDSKEVSYGISAIKIEDMQEKKSFFPDDHPINNQDNWVERTCKFERPKNEEKSDAKSKSKAAKKRSTKNHS